MIINKLKTVTLNDAIKDKSFEYQFINQVFVEEHKDVYIYVLYKIKNFETDTLCFLIEMQGMPKMRYIVDYEIMKYALCKGYFKNPYLYVTDKGFIRYNNPNIVMSKQKNKLKTLLSKMEINAIKKGLSFEMTERKDMGYWNWISFFNSKILDIRCNIQNNDKSFKIAFEIWVDIFGNIDFQFLSLYDVKAKQKKGDILRYSYLKPHNSCEELMESVALFIKDLQNN